MLLSVADVIVGERVLAVITYTLNEVYNSNMVEYSVCINTLIIIALVHHCPRVGLLVSGGGLILSIKP